MAFFADFVLEPLKREEDRLTVGIPRGSVRLDNVWPQKPRFSHSPT
jgi:hypothetical protein